MKTTTLALVVGLVVAGCGTSRTVTRTETVTAVAPGVPTTAPPSTAGTYTLRSSSQPTRCSVWLQGHLAQIIFTSAAVDVDPACNSWVTAMAAGGELWIKNEVSGKPDQETNVCWLHDGSAFAEIQDESGGFDGQRACSALITAGWQESGSG